MQVMGGWNSMVKTHVAAWLLRGWFGTLRYRFVVDDVRGVPHRNGEPSIYVFWHEMLLFLAYTHAGAAAPLVSLSSDGELTDAFIRKYGGWTIRGSTEHGDKPRGGRHAYREMLRRGKTHHLAIALDGAGGPRRLASEGAVVLAGHNRSPIIPIGIAPTLACTVGPKTHRLRVPAPFSLVWYVLGQPLQVPTRVRKQQRPAEVARLQAAMDDVQRRAEHLAAHGADAGFVSGLPKARRL